MLDTANRSRVRIRATDV